MPDSIGRIPVPGVPSSGLTLPSTILPNFGSSMARPWPVVKHRFASLATKAEQRYQVGFGPRRFTFPIAQMNYPQRQALFAFYEQVNGSAESFLFNAYNPGQTTTQYTVIFDPTKPLTVEELANASRSTFTLVEVPGTGTAPEYTVTETSPRNPSSNLSAELLSQVQVVIPLIHIRVRESAVPDIYLSDRRVIVNGQLYLPRILDVGEPGGSNLMTQSITGAADNVQFTFGNADRVMTQLCNDTDLKWASVDLCLLVTQPNSTSGILWQFWKGFIQGATSDGSAKFPIKCSDGLFQIMQMYPARVASRTCWKTFDDGLYCPFSTAGSTPTAVTSAGGDPKQCDYGWNTSNGCLVHGMSLYFGGLPAVPQSVNIKDNSTGFLNWFRNTVTATSIVSDTVWGQVLPEIWCNQGADATLAFWANCLIVAVRDNSSYFDILGVVGAGPLGSYAITGNSAGEFLTNTDGYTYLCGPLGDGFPAQGLKIAANGESSNANSALGLRQVLGNDPIPSTDQGYETFGLANIVGALPQPLAFAAGAALVELLYVKPAGITPTLPEQHSLMVPIAQGLSGRTWDVNGNPTWEGGLTNPVWIAINSYLRAIGMMPLPGDSPATIAAQLAMFSLPDAVASAAICDTAVPSILGTGSSVIEPMGDVTLIVPTGEEIQFQFQGSISTQKPFRDQLKEILRCCLGYYTFEFGVLKIGLRINATPVDTFTIGNMLFQSLRWDLADIRFEGMTVSFADVEYQFQANTGTYIDKDHAVYYGRPGSPIMGQAHIVGCCTLDQALRIAVTEVREEVGGINVAQPGDAIDASEWKALRKGAFKTTLLGLTCGVGDVISITNLDMPGGGMAARVQAIAVGKDWSVTVSFQTVTPDMYSLDVGPTVTAAAPLPLPVIAWPIPLTVWLPAYVQADPHDALFPSEYTFDSDQEYTDLGGGAAQADIIVTGCLPVVSASSAVGVPPGWGTASTSPTGGSIPGGILLRISMVALDATGLPGPAATLRLIQIPSGTNTNVVTLNSITWPSVTGLTQFVVFASSFDDLVCAQETVALTALAGGGYSPVTVSLTSLGSRAGWGIPNPNVALVRIKWKNLFHSGPAGIAVTSVAANQLFCGELADTSGSPVDWTGRVVSVIGRPGASAPFASFNITAFDHTTGTLTLDRDPTGIVLAGDALAIRSQDSSLSSTPAMVGQVNDPLYQNVTNSYAGMNPGEEEGRLIRVVQGTGRGQLPSLVTANTATGLTFQPPLLMDKTSKWIVEGATWLEKTDTSTASNGSPSATATLTVPSTNFLGQPVLVAGFLVDSSGNESPEGDAPMREDWIYGSAGSSPNIGYDDLPIVSNTVTPDLANGTAFRVTLNQAAQVMVNNPVWTGGTLVAGLAITLYIIQDSAGERPTPGWGSAFGSDVAALQIGPYARQPRSAYSLRLHPDGANLIWHVDNFITNQSS